MAVELCLYGGGQEKLETRDMSSKLIEDMKLINKDVDKAILRASENVYSDTILGYVSKGMKHDFNRVYEERYKDRGEDNLFIDTRDGRILNRLKEHYDNIKNLLCTAAEVLIDKNETALFALGVKPSRSLVSLYSRGSKTLVNSFSLPALYFGIALLAAFLSVLFKPLEVR